MKIRFFLSILFVLLSVSLTAQQWEGAQNSTNTIYRTGNVGIGTTSPTGRLHVTSSTYTDMFILERDGSYPGKWEMGNLWSSKTTLTIGKYPLSTAANRYFTIADGGNIGIGTTSPTQKLDINGGIKTMASNALRFWQSNYSVIQRNDNASFWILMTSNQDPDGSYNDLRPFSIALATGNVQIGNNALFVKHGDNVGIGTISPNAKLEIKNTGNGAALLRLSADRAWQFEQKNSDASSRLQLRSLVGNKLFNIVDYNNSNIVASFYARGSASSVAIGKEVNASYRLDVEGTGRYTESVYLATSSGNVGIGTTTIPNNFKLAVNGKIIAEEVVVALFGNWPDYVFQPNYRLLTLKEVETHINTHGHLPDVPSAQTVEENGIGVGEMNAILLKKIEELTLYVIDLQRQLDEVKKSETFR